MRFLKKYFVVYVLLLATFAAGAMAFAKRVPSTASAAVMQSLKSATVVIDPGHGGEDGGAVSAAGCREADLNLQIGLEVRDLLHLLGIQTVMTRTDDVSVHDSSAQSISEKKVSDLKNRAALANSTRGAIFLSIHQNMFSESKYSGAQVFYAQTDGSGILAQLLQDRLREDLDPGNSRLPKQSSGVWLMEHIDCTGVLVECGFLSNPEEEQLLKDPKYQKKLSCVLSCSITEYLTEEIKNDEI